MFEILVYAIALVFTVWFVEQRPAASVRSESDFIDQQLKTIAHTASQREASTLPASIALSKLLNQPRSPLSEGEIAELLEIGTWLDSAPAPAYDLNLPQAQLRALAEVYGVPCSKRGRIGAATLAQLAAVG